MDVELRESNVNVVRFKDFHNPVADGRGRIDGRSDVRPVTEHEVQGAVSEVNEENERLGPFDDLRNGIRHIEQQLFDELGVCPVRDTHSHFTAHNTAVACPVDQPVGTKMKALSKVSTVVARTLILRTTP